MTPHRYLITGGAGFIGANLAAHHLSAGCAVTILDSFRRAGSRQNAAWLNQRFGSRVRIVEADVRSNSPLLREAIEDCSVVYHLAAQVAVTTSLSDPRTDFEINALGTFNVLEAIRQSSSRPIALFSSTNKVYGGLDDVNSVELDTRYAYAPPTTGIDELRALDFHSPYGCSKGIGDQYFLDYARVYGLKTVVFRQSCIYGPRQFGVEDQGWIAWFCIQALRRLPVTVYGNGKQVRDVLYIDDLIQAYDLAVRSIGRTAGRAYNIGGGPLNTLSVAELVDYLGRKLRLRHSYGEWRPGDQRIYVSAIDRAAADFGWTPKVDPETGLARLLGWLTENRHLLEESAPRPTAAAA